MQSETAENRLLTYKIHQILNDLVHTGIYTTRSIKLYQNAHVHAHVNIIS